MAWVAAVEAVDIRCGVTVPYDPERHHRRSIRLPEYDYSQGGAYFVTICMQGRACSVGAVNDGEIRLSEQGEIVAGCWAAIADHFPTVVLDASVIMPNHLHGSVFLSDPGVKPDATTPSVARPTLATIIGVFKSASARRVNALQGIVGGFWQRGYYEHIIRNERNLARLQTYIAENPQRWATDRLYRGDDVAGYGFRLPHVVALPHDPMSARITLYRLRE